MNLNHSEYNDFQTEIKAEIEIKVKANTWLSEAMDECTSVLCQRYININVHSQNDVINLGLTRML